MSDWTKGKAMGHERYRPGRTMVADCDGPCDEPECCDKPEAVPHIEVRLNHLTDNIERLGKSLEVLFEELRPVRSMNAGKCDGSKGCEEMPSCSEVAQRLIAMQTRVRDLIEAVDIVREQLEI